MGTLYIVATPIGNLSDLTFRALETLHRVDLILCEDTRVTSKLLQHYQIGTRVLSYHAHSKLRKIETIIELLKKGENIALVCDAGTPGISDPGTKLIACLTKEFGSSLKIIPIPGASALISGASISGFPMSKFPFLGFPPAKKRRKRFFEELAHSKYPVIFFEAPHRILKTLKELQNILGSEKREIVVCRELTKKFETTYRGAVDEVFVQIGKEKVSGEFVIIIGPKFRAKAPLKLQP